MSRPDLMPPGERNDGSWGLMRPRRVPRRIRRRLVADVMRTDLAQDEWYEYLTARYGGRPSPHDRRAAAADRAYERWLARCVVGDP